MASGPHANTWNGFLISPMSAPAGLRRCPAQPNEPSIVEIWAHLRDAAEQAHVALRCAAPEEELLLGLRHAKRYGPPRADHAACAACLYYGRLLRMRRECCRSAGAAHRGNEETHPGIRVRARSHVREPCRPTWRRGHPMSGAGGGEDGLRSWPLFRLRSEDP